MTDPASSAGAATSEPAAAELSADPAVRRTLRVLGSVVAPATLITALLYYFGWTATHASAAYLGIDESLLSFSTQDYLLRSVNPVFWPLAVGLIVAALALHGHIRVMRYIRHPEPRVRIVWIIGGTTPGQYAASMMVTERYDRETLMVLGIEDDEMAFRMMALPGTSTGST